MIQHTPRLILSEADADKMAREFTIRDEQSDRDRPWSYAYEPAPGGLGFYVVAYDECGDRLGPL